MEGGPWPPGGAMATTPMMSPGSSYGDVRGLPGPCPLPPVATMPNSPWPPHQAIASRGPPDVKPMLNLAELEGTWSSDCGLMTIVDGVVRDANGEAAPLGVAPDQQLELRFAGQLWRSWNVDCDHIRWEGDGGCWTRVSVGIVAANSAKLVEARRGSVTPGCDPSSYRGSVADPTSARVAGTVGDPTPRSSWPATGSMPPWPEAGPCFPVTQMPTPPWGGGPLGGFQRPPWPQLTINAPSPVGQPIENLEQKVDFLTGAVASLQGQLQQMMEARRDRAKRRPAQVNYWEVDPPQGAPGAAPPAPRPGQQPPPGRLPPGQESAAQNAPVLWGADVSQPIPHHVVDERMNARRAKFKMEHMAKPDVPLPDSRRRPAFGSGW